MLCVPAVNETSAQIISEVYFLLLTSQFNIINLHTYIYTYIHTYIYTYIHTYTATGLYPTTWGYQSQSRSAERNFISGNHTHSFIHTSTFFLSYTPTYIHT